MTYDEAKTKLTKILEEPDSALVNIAPFLEEMKTDYETLETVKETNKKNEERIRSLQDTNMKLFLAQTGEVKDSSDDEPKELTFGEKFKQLEEEK